MSPTSYDLAIVGAGPAGMMAAIRASECGVKVLIIERNARPGIKLLMTGKERCNITNSQENVLTFIENFGRNGKFLISAMHRFGVAESVDFFHENGLATKIERGGRIFPESDRSRDVLELLLGLCKKQGVRIYDQCRIETVQHDENGISALISENGDTITARNYLIATGGRSYPETGSTGDGYRLAETLGHSTIKPAPALTPLLTREKWVRDLEGLSLKNVRISLVCGTKKNDERFGEALFTGNGISGPIILDLSKTAGSKLQQGEVKLAIDFKPALDQQMLDKRLLRDLDEKSNRQMDTIMLGLLPKRLVPIVLKLANIDPLKRGHSVSKDERKRLRLTMKEFPLTISGLVGFKKAIITAGGVSLKEVDPNTMRSKIVPNLFFAGEILDLDGPTGGFNLQVCWTTGYVAGESAAEG